MSQKRARPYGATVTVQSARHPDTACVVVTAEQTGWQVWWSLWPSQLLACLLVAKDSITCTQARGSLNDAYWYSRQIKLLARTGMSAFLQHLSNRKAGLWCMTAATHVFASFDSSCLLSYEFLRCLVLFIHVGVTEAVSHWAACKTAATALCMMLAFLILFCGYSSPCMFATLHILLDLEHFLLCIAEIGGAHWDRNDLEADFVPGTCVAKHTCTHHLLQSRL